jgi:hypothetical protein
MAQAFADAAQPVCGQAAAAIKALAPTLAEEHAPYLCLDLAYCYSLLTQARTGFGVQAARPCLLVQKRALGASIPAAGRCKHAGSRQMPRLALERLVRLAGLGLALGTAATTGVLRGRPSTKMVAAASGSGNVPWMQRPWHEPVRFAQPEGQPRAALLDSKV